ncbi:MAG: hypothetical protein OXH22_04220 [Chloroflexi bacterium]|nr:hypothetical protein [Chloroflexota bacterium]
MRLGWVYFAPLDVVLTDNDVVQPDLVVDILPPSTSRLDRTGKRKL